MKVTIAMLVGLLSNPEVARLFKQEVGPETKEFLHKFLVGLSLHLRLPIPVIVANVGKLAKKITKSQLELELTDTEASFLRKVQVVMATLRTQREAAKHARRVAKASTESAHKPRHLVLVEDEEKEAAAA